MRIIAAIVAALSYAHNPEVKQKLEATLQKLDKDLEDVGYDLSTDAEDAVKELETAMNEFDEAVSSRRAEQKEAAAMARELGDDEPETD